MLLQSSSPRSPIFDGDMAWEKNEFVHQDKINKLYSKWKRPYKVVVIAYPNAYVLENMQGKKLKNIFNT